MGKSKCNTMPASAGMPQQRAENAKGRATAAKKGKISPAAAARIRAKANRILGQ